MPTRSHLHLEAITAACRMIEQAEEIPSLDALAKEAGIGRFHFHRVFKEITGFTPKGYATAHRAVRLRKELGSRRTVTEAIYESGFNASSRFYEQSSGLLGMTAKSFKAGGKGEVVRFAIGQCSLGSILVASSKRGVCAILMGDDPEALAIDLQGRFPKAELVGGDGSFERLVAQVVGFVETPKVGLDLRLDVRGTAFQRRAWQALREIPVGSTATYTEIAQMIGKPSAVRAVAGACAANALAVAIPCHRVVRTDGSLSGYRWGLERKRSLLHREGNL